MASRSLSTQRRNPNASLKRVAIDVPIDVGQLDALIDDRAGHAETGGFDLVGAMSRLLEEPGKDVVGRVEFERVVLADEQLFGPHVGRLAEQPEERLGAAEVACEKHCASS